MKRFSDSATYRDRLKRLRLSEQKRATVVLTDSSEERASLSENKGSAASNVEREVQSVLTRNHSEGGRRDEEETSDIRGMVENLQMEVESADLQTGRLRKDPILEGMVHLSWPQGYSDNFTNLLGKQHFTHFQSREQRDFFMKLWNQKDNRNRKGLGLNYPNAYKRVIIGNEVDRGTLTSHFVKEKGVPDHGETLSTATPLSEGTSKGAGKASDQESPSTGADEGLELPSRTEYPAEHLSMKDAVFLNPGREQTGDVIKTTVAGDNPQRGEETEKEGDAVGQEENTLAEEIIVSAQPDVESLEASVKKKSVFLSAPDLTFVIASSTPVMDSQITTMNQKKVMTGVELQERVDEIHLTCQAHSDKLLFVESDVRRLRCSLLFMNNLGSEVDSIKQDLKETSEECSSLRVDSNDMSNEICELRDDLKKYREDYNGLAASHEAFKTQVNLEVSAIQARLICLEARKMAEIEEERRKLETSELQKSQAKGFQLCVDSLISSKLFPPEMLHNESFIGMVADPESLREKLQSEQNQDWPAWKEK